MHDQVNQDKLIGRISIRLLPFLFLLYIISYLDRINLSFAALQMNQELQFSDQAFGLGPVFSSWATVFSVSPVTSSSKSSVPGAG